MKLFFLLAIGLLVSPLAWSQQILLSGTVKTTQGEALPGVSVVVEGTTLGTATDPTGNFQLTVPSAKATLAFSFVGYVSQRRLVTASAQLSVVLQESAQQLNEVVVTGLATSVKRENLANAVTTLSAKRIMGTTTPSTLDGALSGKVVGAVITQNAGAPGGGVSIQLRGISSITGSSQPLFIVDGVIINNATFENGRGTTAFTGANNISTGQDNIANRLADLNPADIENIEILKGSSAAAIYGTLANAGVVLITTKKGQSGRTQIRFNQDVAFITATRFLPYAGWDPAKIRNYFPDSAQAEHEVNAWQSAQQAGKVFNYPREIYGRTALGTYSQLSLSGGNDKTRFYASGGYTDEQGLVRNTGFARSSLRTNLTHNFRDNWDVQFNSNFVHNDTRRGWENNDNNGVTIGTNLTALPNYADLHRRPDGSYPYNPYYNENPFRVIDQFVNTEITNRFIQSVATNYYVLNREHQQLRLGLQFGADLLATEAHLYAPDQAQSQQSAVSGYPGASRYQTNRNLSTNWQLTAVHTLTGAALTHTSSAGLVRYGQDLLVTATQGEGLVGGQQNPNNAALRTTNNFIQSIVNVGAFAQHEVNWRDRVVATLALRVDKNSTNADANKFYGFPKAALAVNLAQFGFWSLPKINQLKLRVAYGETGGPAAFGTGYSALSPVVYQNQLGITAPLTQGYPNIRYETAREVETGIDVGLLDNRITLEVTYYDKKVRNLLQQLQLSPSTGYESVTGYPVGDLRNRGLEVSLNATPVNQANFRWNTVLNYWFNRSLTTRLDIPSKAVGPNLGALYGFNELRVGQSPTAWVGTPVVSEGRYTVYGDAQPRFQLSSFNELTLWKNLQLSFLWHWKYKGYNSNYTRFQTDLGGDTYDWNVPTNRDASGNLIPGPPVPTGLARQQGLTAAYFIEDASYLKLREVALYYSVPSAALAKVFGHGLTGLKMGISGNNLLRFTHYTGYDPEVSAFGTSSVGSNFDIVSAPPTKRVLMHVGFEF